MPFKMAWEQARRKVLPAAQGHWLRQLGEGEGLHQKRVFQCPCGIGTSRSRGHQDLVGSCSIGDQPSSLHARPNEPRNRIASQRPQTTTSTLKMTDTRKFIMRPNAVKVDGEVVRRGKRKGL